MFSTLSRITCLRAAMADSRMEFVLIPPSSDYFYFTASRRMASQRIVILGISAETCFLLMPSFECANEPTLSDRFTILPYQDSDNPLELLDTHLPKDARIAVSPEMKAGLLIALHQRRPDLSFTDASSLLVPLRKRKDSQELAIIEKAQHMAEHALQRLISNSVKGMTEKQLAEKLMQLRLEEGFDSVGSGIIASGENTALPHHINSDRAIRDGDALMFDIGGTYRGYHADFTRTFSVGTPTEEFKKIYDIVLTAHQAGRDAAKLGALACNVDLAARQVIEQAGYGAFFPHRLGHGIGLDVHEPPFLSTVSTDVLENGNVFSCEPGIYLPGRFGIRIEDLLVMENGNVRSLNTLSKELIIIS